MIWFPSSSFSFDRSGFSEVKIRALLETPSVKSAWIAGSYVEGIASRTSDLDLYAICDDDVLRCYAEFNRRNERFGIRITFVEGIRVDIEYWTEDAVRALLQKFSALAIENGEENILDALTEDETQFLVRIHLSIPVVAPENVTAIRELVPFERLQRYLLENKRHYLDDAFDDTLGFIGSGDLDSACQRARDTLEFAVDMFLIRAGFINVKHKHRRRLMRLVPSTADSIRLFELYEHVQAHLPRVEKQQMNFIKSALSGAEYVVRQEQLR